MIVPGWLRDWERHHLIPSDRQRRRAGKFPLGEMLSIMVLFHISAYKAFKPFRLYGLSQRVWGLLRRTPQL